MTDSFSVFFIIWKKEVLLGKFGSGYKLKFLWRCGILAVAYCRWSCSGRSTLKVWNGDKIWWCAADWCGLFPGRKTSDPSDANDNLEDGDFDASEKSESDIDGSDAENDEAAEKDDGPDSEDREFSDYDEGNKKLDFVCKAD
jgi:hypothetical protein